MIVGAKVTGLKALSLGLKASKSHIDAKLPKALLTAGLFIQRESQKIVPVDTDVLRPSADTRMDPINSKPSVIVVYTTGYAIYVHEDMEARHSPGKQAKFLEQPLREKRKRVIEIVTDIIKGTF